MELMARVGERALIVFGLACAALLAGCQPIAPYTCCCLAHPTMTPDEVVSGVDARVRSVSEGASGRLGERHERFE
jgi:hypothetical protein